MSEYDDVFDALMDRVEARMDELADTLADALDDVGATASARYHSAAKSITAASGIPLRPFGGGAMACAWPADAARLAVVDGLQADDLHITIRYLGDNEELDDDTRDSVRDVMDAVGLQQPPLLLVGGTIEHLGDPDDNLGYVAVAVTWAAADNTDLYAMAARAHEALDGVGAHNASQYTDWLAHMTLSWLPQEDAERRYPVGTPFAHDVIIDTIGAKFGGTHWLHRLDANEPAVAVVAAGAEPGPEVDPDTLWDSARWSAAIDDAENTLLDIVHTEGGHLGLAWDVKSPEVANIAAKHIATIKDIDAVARTHLSSTITASVRNGWSIERTAERLQAGPFGKHQAINLARTEVISAANMAQHHAFTVTAKDGDTKRWLSTPDERTRPTHRAANGQEVPFDKPFNVGGHNADAPGDVALPAQERHQCRCTFIFVRAEKNKVKPVVSDASPELAEPADTSTGPSLVPNATMAAEARKGLKWAEAEGAAGSPPASLLDLAARISERVELIDTDLTTITAAWETHRHGLSSDGAKPHEPGFPNEWRILTALVGGHEGDAWARRKLRALARSHSINASPTPAEDQAMATATIDHDAIIADYVSNPNDLVTATDGLVAAGGSIRNIAAPITAAAETDDDAMDWESLMAVEGIETGDGRRIDVGALTWRDLPLSLLFQEQKTSGGHDGAHFAGSIRRITRVQNEIHGKGKWDSGDWGKEAARMVEEKTVKGISVDLTDLESELIYEESFADPMEEMFAEPSLMLITSARIAAATIVSTPAFAEAFIKLIDEEDPEGNPVRFGGLAASGADLTRAARVFIPIEYNEEGAMVASGSVTRINERRKLFSDEDRARAMHPDPSDFAPIPDSLGPVPFTVDGHRVYGHVALFGSCHIGVTGRCQDVPRSTSGYAAFHGENPQVPGGTHVVCSDGSKINVGRIFANTVHPDLHRVASDAASHYADTGTLGALVRAYETEWGVAVSGVVNPGVTDETLFAMRATDVSGDWRPLGGGLEMVGLLSVNVGGFNKAIAASAAPTLDGRASFRTLVASGGEVAAMVGGHSRLHMEKVRAGNLSARLAAVEAHLGIEAPCEDCDADEAPVEIEVDDAELAALLDLPPTAEELADAEAAAVLDLV